MNEYRSTINIPECKRGETVELPDNPRTAVLVGEGILVPVVRYLTDPEPEHRKRG